MLVLLEMVEVHAHLLQQEAGVARMELYPRVQKIRFLLQAVPHRQRACVMLVSLEQMEQPAQAVRLENTRRALVQ